MINAFFPHQAWLSRCFRGRQGSVAAARKVTWFTTASHESKRGIQRAPWFSQATFSMMTAMPWPPPMQAEPTAYFPPRRLSS